ncbi:SusC/RagA family TonB-linked outer membrane protein [Lacibacter sp. MH-610]|uniref:SusC/RagA family TonB-linked outer membrane protein n=1 Tax=Lacibacter sp. MH-610 TaxID=3020883 RepID=UPI0038926654
MTLMKFARGMLTSLVSFLVFTNAFAQSKTVTGKITDSKGDAVPSATVTVKGTNNSTSTAADGSFSISVPSGSKTLVVSSVGFETKEVAISDNMSITLETKNAALNEVVVVGYGSRKVKDLTGSVANITPKDFNKGQIGTPDQLIQGRTPGVLVTPSTGQPGAAPTITIRGTASIRGNQQPLYVIDGVPVSNVGGTVGSASGVEGGTTPLSPLVFLNPNDIESMVILKDASAAAIYGSRGANGVILITTRGGKGGKKGQFNFGANTSISTTAKRYDLLSPDEFLAQAKRANIDGGSDPATAAVAVQAIDGGANTDWQDEIFRTAISQNYNLGWGFNTKRSTVRLSGSYDDQQGIVRNSSLKRFTTRANLSQKFFEDKLKFDVAATYSNTKNEYPPLSNNAGFQGSLLGAALQFNPTYPVKNPDGSFYQPGDQRNPTQMLAYFEDKDNINRFLTSVAGTYQIVKGLSYKAVFGYDRTTTERIAFADPRLGANAYGGTTILAVPSNGPSENLNNPIFGNGRATKQNNTFTSILFEQYLTWDKTIKDHSINAVAGYSYQKFENDYTQKVGWGVNIPVVRPNDVFVKNFNNFKNYRDLFPGFYQEFLQSFFGRVNYSYGDKYFVTATVRVDGSSKFGANNRYGTFPAFALKWKLSNEKFFEKSLGKYFADFSLRANYGILGSQDGLDPYGAIRLGFAYPAFGTNQAGTHLIVDENKDLRWEQAATTGVGLDFTTNDNRLSVTLDYYYTERKDLLFLGYTPGGFSATSRLYQNLDGFVVNKGWEFSANYKIVTGKKFNWDASYNMTTVENQYKNLDRPIITGEVSGQGLTGAYAQTIQEGQSLFTWSMLEFLGFDGNGFARYAKGASNQIVGSALPTFFAGLTNNFSLGNWNLSVFINAVTGFKVYNNTANALFLKGSLRNARNVTREVGFGNENPFNPGSVSTRFLEKGDFIRLSNVNLSYNFNLKSKAIRSLSVFASGQNLALLTKYSGIDPEVNVDKQLNGVPSRGFDYTQYPRPRVITLGVNLAF